MQVLDANHVSLHDTIKLDRLNCRQDKSNNNQIKANLLGVVLGQLDQSKDYSDENIVKIIVSLMKSINERIIKKYSFDDYQKALVEKQCLENYLPQALDLAEMKRMFDHMVFNNKGEFMQVAKKYCVVQGILFDGKIAGQYYDDRQISRDLEN